MFQVWPALYLYAGGPLLSKGVAQGCSYDPGMNAASPAVGPRRPPERSPLYNVASSNSNTANFGGNISSYNMQTTALYINMQPNTYSRYATQHGQMEIRERSGPSTQQRGQEYNDGRSGNKAPGTQTMYSQNRASYVYDNVHQKGNSRPSHLQTLDTRRLQGQPHMHHTSSAAKHTDL